MALKVCVGARVTLSLAWRVERGDRALAHFLTMSDQI